MIFKTLKEKAEYYRSLTDYRLLPNGYILVMIDGKNFSKLIKNKFEKPFSETFITIMNQTAEHVSKELQGCVGAYVQSDEISFLIKDDSGTCLPFDGRLCKFLSIIPSIASSFFTKKIIEKNQLDLFTALSTCETNNEIEKICKNVNDIPDYCFDCKAWNVPNDDVISWFLYRQIDCVRNSKQQFCQTYLPHKRLVKLNCDEQVKLCKEETAHDWNEISDDKKYGRFFYKDIKSLENEKGETYYRRVWNICSIDLTNPDNREYLKNKWFNNAKI